MDKQIRVGEQLVRFDPQATTALYENTITKAGADECGCTYCRNFAAQRMKAYPDEFIGLLAQLGADPRKELEAFYYSSGPENPKRHLYGGWFVFSGELIGGNDWRPEHRGGTFTYWFTTNFPRGDFPKEQAVCAVEFLTELRWVLSEPPE